MGAAWEVAISDNWHGYGTGTNIQRAWCGLCYLIRNSALNHLLALKGMRCGSNDAGVYVGAVTTTIALIMQHHLMLRNSATVDAAGIPSSTKVVTVCNLPLLLLSCEASPIEQPQDSFGDALY